MDWFAQNWKKFGTKLEFVTDCSPEGSQFCRGFGGIGGLLRYKVDFQELDPDTEPVDSDDSASDDFW